MGKQTLVAFAAAIVGDFSACGAFSVATAPISNHRSPTGFWKTKVSPLWQNDSSDDFGYDSDPDGLIEAHTVAATHDPSWYKEYVESLLGSDFDMVVEAKTRTKTAKAQPRPFSVDAHRATEPVPLHTESKAVEPERVLSEVKNEVKSTENSDDEYTKLYSKASKILEDAHRSEQGVPVAESNTGEEDSQDVVQNSITEEESVKLKVPEEKLSVEGAKKAPIVDDPEMHPSTKDTAVATKSPRTRITKKRNHDESFQAEKSTDIIADNTGDTLEDDKVVVYMDLGQRLQSVQISNLTALGYDASTDILQMQSDALAVILNDQIQRPRTGVPRQWKSEKTEVKIVSADEAEEMVQEHRADSRVETRMKTKRNEGSFPPTSQKRRPDLDERRAALKETGLDETRETERKQRIATERDDISSQPRRKRDKESRRRIPSGDERHPDGGRPKRRSAFNEDGSPKRIYSGRNEVSRRPPPTTRSSDPPAPSKVWMDMDTFRGLLRTEADLRLSILGEDFLPTVQAESDWRLNMYKKWLWMLNDGVGESIIPPSRSDRARRAGQRPRGPMEEESLDLDRSRMEQRSRRRRRRQPPPPEESRRQRRRPKPSDRMR